jgi:hypothetical protein
VALNIRHGRLKRGYAWETKHARARRHHGHGTGPPSYPA